MLGGLMTTLYDARDFHPQTLNHGHTVLVVERAL
jgi:hypothetical protein